MKHEIKTSRVEPSKVVAKEFLESEFSTGKSFPEKVNGHLPTMGWNSWNAFGTGNNEALTKAMCEKLNELGLSELGYKYVVLDDGCYNNERQNGKLTNFPERFPSGFKALADFVHEKGLKFGMYNDVGSRLCSGLEVGTCGFEDLDAQSYIDWDIDFIKIDNCYYLWDNATFSDATNAKYTYAPNIKSVSVKADGFEKTVKASECILKGRGARLAEGGYVTGLGTFDGTNVGPTPVGAQSSEAWFEFSVEKAGQYDIYAEFASGMQPEIGAWLQIKVNDTEEYAFDEMVELTETTETFVERKLISLPLKAGKNVIKLMNHRRQENTLMAYSAMFYAFKEFTDKDIRISICEWGKTNPQNWGYKVGNSWRILNDITFWVGRDGDPGKARWEEPGTASIASQYDKAVVMDEYAGLDKGWNDPDMLVIGMNGIDLTMMQTHMAMWCMMNSPLMLGLDLRRVEKGDDLWKIIANKDLIDLNQDALGIQAKRVYSTLCEKDADITYITNNDRADILAKPLANGDIAISFFNLSGHEFNDLSIDINTVLAKIGKKCVNGQKLSNASKFKTVNLITKEECVVEGGVFECKKLAAYDNLTIRVSAC